MTQYPASPESYLQLSYQIRNRGSFTIPEEARKAHRLILDVEIVSVTRTQYQNFLYNMPQGDYCNITFWSGSTIARTEKIKYPSQRLIDWVNIEASLCLNAAGVGVTIIETIKSLGAALELVVTETDGQAQAVWGYPVTHVKVVCPEDTQVLLTCTWYPFARTPLVNDINPQTEEPSDAEDEYKSPSRNPASDPWKDNAPISSPQPERDSRDYWVDTSAPSEPNQTGGTAPSGGLVADRTGTPSQCAGENLLIPIPAGATYSFEDTSSTCGNTFPGGLGGKNLLINGSYAGFGTQWVVRNP